MARRSTGTRLRFEIFKRDGFRCVYCGSTPVQSPLQVDHVVPLAGGGDHSAANMVTSCGKCNAGKSDVPLDRKSLAAVSAASVEAQREHAEQIRAFLAAQTEIDDARRAVVDGIEDRWECVIGPMSQASRIASLARQTPLQDIFEAIDITGGRLGATGEKFDSYRANGQVKYFYGVLRKRREAAEGK